MKAISKFFGSMFLILHELVTAYMSSSGMMLHASPNTLTNLIPHLYKALHVVSREQIGFIPAGLRDSRAESVALNEDVVISTVPSASAVSITPGATAPDTGGATVDNPTLTV